MALKASFYIHHPWSISHLRLTEKYVVASTVAGTVYVLDRQCRCVESSSDCEHLTTMEVGKMWDIDCCQDTLVTGNDDGMVRVWDASTGYVSRKFHSKLY
jgi:WD40 repeat protein